MAIMYFGLKWLPEAYFTGYVFDSNTLLALYVTWMYLEFLGLPSSRRTHTSMDNNFAEGFDNIVVRPHRTTVVLWHWALTSPKTSYSRAFGVKGPETTKTPAKTEPQSRKQFF